ncbi:MAG: hypothetical protein ABR577_19890, partial [Pyrinomonadaceae bacterium]
TAISEGQHDHFARQEEERRVRENETPPAAPQTEAERIAQLMEEVREKVAKKKAKAAKRNAPPEAASKSVRTPQAATKKS